MGRGILHRKVMQNKRRVALPDADHLMAETHYDRPPPPPPVELDPLDSPVSLTRRELAELLARLDELETPPESATA